MSKFDLSRFSKIESSSQPVMTSAPDKVSVRKNTNSSTVVFALGKTHCKNLGVLPGDRVDVLVDGRDIAITPNGSRKLSKQRSGQQLTVTIPKRFEISEGARMDAEVYDGALYFRLPETVRIL